MFSQTCNDWDIKAILLFKDSAAMVSGLPNSEAYNSVATLQWKLRNSNRSIFNMTSNEINMLKYYSETMDGYADMYALNMLRISGDTNYNEPIVLTSEERTKIFPVSEPVSDSYNLFQVFPNPAGNYITIVLNEQSQKNIICELSDSKGVILRSEILPTGCTELYLDLTGIENGIYFLGFKSDNATKQVKKIVVKK
ncbi:hypothetical protein DSECCO2_575410 [anaerobic digester metagenome]